MKAKTALIRAVEAAIPCLEDWVEVTGYGEIYTRDLAALRLCLDALKIARDEKEKKCFTCG